MRVRSNLVLSAVAAGAVFLATGCGGTSTPGVTPPAPAPASPGGDPTFVDVGVSLYPPVPPVNVERPLALGREYIVIPNSTVLYEERQQVSAAVDAMIEMIATQLPPGTVIDPKDRTIVYHPRDPEKKVPYRRLSEGDEVKFDQVICVLDNQLVTTKKEAAIKAKSAADELRKCANDGVKYTRDKLKLTQSTLEKGVAAMADYLNDKVTEARFLENLAQADQTLYKAEADYQEAEVMLGRHWVRSSVNGIIRSIAKRPGEFVKAGDKIMEVQATDKVRVEGSVDAQYAPLVKDVQKRGIDVTVEPALPSAPVKSHAWHRLEVTGVAVTAHPGRPLVVSTGADGQALVWDANRDSAAHGLPHPVAVRSVACSPLAKPALVVTGGDDGKIRIWDLSNPDKLPTAAAIEPSDTHGAAVTAITFSPDGKFFATAAGRDVFVWSAGEGKKLYALPTEHRDTVTSLTFTPQCTLVTASKDKTVKVWKLGAEKGAVAKTIDHRSGSVDVLGVSKDGGRLLFDQDKGRIDLVSLSDKQTVGQIQNMGSTASFATLALFNADDSLLVTAGGEGELKGTLQVWTTPKPGGRGSEIARLMTPARVGVTCGAFSPVKDSPFLVVGTDKGSVHLWRPPSDAARATSVGKVTNIDATDARTMTVRVELDNTVLKLFDRSAATIIINPGQ
jgi:WD40 repeat protein